MSAQCADTMVLTKCSVSLFMQRHMPSRRLRYEVDPSTPARKFCASRSGRLRSWARSPAALRSLEGLTHTQFARLRAGVQTSVLEGGLRLLVK